MPGQTGYRRIGDSLRRFLLAGPPWRASRPDHCAHPARPRRWARCQLIGPRLQACTCVARRIPRRQNPRGGDPAGADVDSRVGRGDRPGADRHQPDGHDRGRTYPSAGRGCRDRRACQRTRRGLGGHAGGGCDHFDKVDDFTGTLDMPDIDRLGLTLVSRAIADAGQMRGNAGLSRLQVDPNGNGKAGHEVQIVSVGASSDAAADLQLQAYRISLDRFAPAGAPCRPGGMRVLVACVMPCGVLPAAGVFHAVDERSQPH